MEQNTEKTPNELSKVFFVAHLLPVGLFTTAIFCGIFLVTACGPTKASTLKDQVGGIASQNTQQTSTVVGSSSLSGPDLIKKLSGFWDCVTPASSSGDCYGENITFSAALDQMTLETMIPLEDGDCHLQINYKITEQVLPDGKSVNLTMTDTQTAKLLDDPANASECASEFNTTKKIGLNKQRTLTYNADWSQIILDGVHYARPAPADSAATASAETWISP